MSYFNTHLLNWRLLFLGGHNYASMWKVILMPKGSMHLLFLIPWTSWPLNSLSYNRPLWLCHISSFISIYISRHKKLNCLSELIRESVARETCTWQLTKVVHEGGVQDILYFYCVFMATILSVYLPPCEWYVEREWERQRKKERENNTARECRWTANDL